MGKSYPIDKLFSHKIAAGIYNFITGISSFLTKYIKIYWIFILLFAQTGTSKLMNIGKFQFAMWKAPSLRPYFIELSYFIPIAELVIAVLLVFPFIQIRKLKIPSRTIGLCASLLLMLAFTLYIGYALAFEGNKLPCPCGGLMKQLNWKQHLVLNVILTSLAFRAIRLTYKKNKSIKYGYR